MEERLPERISIHTALAGCDAYTPVDTTALEISIHTALAGCDYCELKETGTYADFNPHSPRRL